MVKRIGSRIRKAKHKFKKSIRESSKTSLSRYFQNFEEGGRVCLKADSAHQKGIFPPRFYGKIGIIKKKVGKCYAVEIKDGNKLKILQIHPIHLIRRI